MEYRLYWLVYLDISSMQKDLMLRQNKLEEKIREKDRELREIIDKIAGMEKFQNKLEQDSRNNKEDIHLLKEKASKNCQEFLGSYRLWQYIQEWYIQFHFRICPAVVGGICHHCVRIVFLHRTGWPESVAGQKTRWTAEYPSGIPEQLRIDRSRYLLFLHLPLLRSFGIYHPCTHGVNRSEDDACL